MNKNGRTYTRTAYEMMCEVFTFQGMMSVYKIYKTGLKTKSSNTQTLEMRLADMYIEFNKSPSGEDKYTDNAFRKGRDKVLKCIKKNFSEVGKIYFMAKGGVL